jgi:hypothetical protein
MVAQSKIAYQTWAVLIYKETLWDVDQK